MDYSKLSDFEINGRVAIAEGLQVQEIDDSKATGMTSKYHELRPNTVWVSDGENPWEQYAPTLCWEDAGPIIAAKKICLAFDVFAEPQDGGGWVASPAYGWETERVRHDNPLRAAMILFLKMQESA